MNHENFSDTLHHIHVKNHEPNVDNQTFLPMYCTADLPCKLTKQNDVFINAYRSLQFSICLNYLYNTLSQH